MKNITIIYWSGTGNTEKMANLISDGATECGAKVNVLNVSEAKLDDVKNADVLAFGCPAMGVETIEECEMEPFIDSISDILADKRIALFGSYGWGTGEWMQSWVETMNGYGSILINDGLIVEGEPEGETEEQCIELGKELSK